MIKNSLVSKIIIFLCTWLILATTLATLSIGFIELDHSEHVDRLAELGRAEGRVIAGLMEPLFAAAYSFSGLIELNPDFEKPGNAFEQHSKRLIERWPLIYHISIAPNGIVSHIYPREGNLGAIGLDLFNDPVRRGDAILARDTRSLVVTGPYELAVGGLGLTARYPVFIPDPKQVGSEKFWGFAVTVIKLGHLLEASELSSLEEKGYHWSLTVLPSKTSPDQKPGIGALIASSGSAPLVDPIFTEIHLPNSTWLLALASVDGDVYVVRRNALIIASLITSLIAAFLFSSYLNKRRNLARLAKSLTLEVAERKKAEALLAASVEAKDILLREIHHRVKNNLAVVESIVSLQSLDAQGTRFEEAFSQLAKRIHSISLIHEKLYRGRDLDHIEAGPYIRDLVTNICSTLGESGTVPQVDVDDIDLSSKAAMPIGLILTELLTNAYKYGFKGKISVSLIEKGPNLILAVENEGPPLPEGFRDTNGLGLRLVDALVSQLFGSWEAESGPPVRFQVEFPLNPGSLQESGQ